MLHKHEGIWMEDFLQFENKLNNIDNKIFSLTKKGGRYCAVLEKLNKWINSRDKVEKKTTQADPNSGLVYKHKYKMDKYEPV